MVKYQIYIFEFRQKHIKIRIKLYRANWKKKRCKKQKIPNKYEDDFNQAKMKI